MDKTPETTRKVGRPLGSTKFTEAEALFWLENFLKVKEEQKRIPYLEEFAVKWLDMNVDAVSEYTKNWPNFSEAVKKLKDFQKFGLMEGFRPMDIFLLKCNHNMIETEKRIIAGDPHNPLLPNSYVKFELDDKTTS